MEQYINKSAVAAEIERIKKEECPIDTYEGRMKLFYFERFLSFLDTLEIKEVDLEKELDKYTADNFWALEGDNESPYLLEKDDMLKVAKYFYELGLNSQKE